MKAPLGARISVSVLAIAALIAPGAWTTAATAAPARIAQPQATAHPLTPKQIARQLMAQKFGWKPASQFHCLDLLWTRESRWNVRAYNPYSGATGIPQAVPGSKMASAGPSWRTNPWTQIRWGLRYIKSRYGSPRAAWAHERARGWY